MTEGLGVMINRLGGIEGAIDPSKYNGCRVTSAELDTEKNELRLELGDSHVVLVLTDEGQSCCEDRYMTCDDDMRVLVGGDIVSIEAAEGGGTDDGDSCHEMVFVKIQTTAGGVTVCTHNEHNGYYGGFSLVFRNRQL